MLFYIQFGIDMNVFYHSCLNNTRRLITEQRKASSAEDMTRKKSIGKLYKKVNKN